MFVSVTLLGSISLIPFSVVGVFRTCIPNTQFQMNGHICYCDGLGRWSEADCEIARRKSCQPGQIVWEDCNQCICQENGQMQCISAACGEDKTKVAKELDIGNLWCLPFVSYYVNCSLCVCPASGKISEARCAKDASCPFKDSTDFLEAVKQNVCIPKVMYLFPCLHCHCSDEGYFLVDKCVETCHKPLISDSARRCIPETFYRQECNICRCPKNGIANDEMCSKSKCNNRFGLYSLNKLRNRTIGCHRNTFTSPTCFFCECNQDASVNGNSCLESECMFMDNIKYGFVKDKCSPGEMVPYCSECLCLRNGATDPKYCTDVCSHQQKLITLEMVIMESFTNNKIIDKKALLKAASSGVCDPNSIYLDEGKYCLCPDNGNTKFKLCISTTEKYQRETKSIEELQTPSNAIDFSGACDPSTFVEFDCNTCYCPKSGQLDPKWCTYDDCEAKKTILLRHEKMLPDEVVDAKGMCVPGSIIKEECNFCICPTNGKLKDKACTKNNCVELRHTQTPGVEKFTCEPLLYYSVDCNTCYCPKNGHKNLAICTKNICEKSFLRTEVCVPGELFGHDCNVCVCPPNGDKSDRVCTDHVCSDADTPWKKIFKLSQTLLSNNVEDATRSLELCFPGEEYVVGCKICVCPDMGLRVYATCTRMLCEEDGNPKELSDDEASKVAHVRTRREQDGACLTYKLIDSSERKECTPGSIYIIRCKQCICPYMGNINYFCRPLPVEQYCEQAAPGYNYLPMGRRVDESDSKSTTQRPRNITKGPSKPRTTFGHKHIKRNTSTVKHTNTTRKPDAKEIQQITRTHNHTIHACDKPGRVIDDCFICDCVEHVIIQEHCFKSDAENCKNSTPTFLRDKVLD